MSDKHPNCPNCGRPMGVEYVETEPGKCQLWRRINEHDQRAPRTVFDCFGHTSRRIREMAARIAELEASKAAAQRSLARHHGAVAARSEPAKPQDMFPDNARIE